MAMNNGFTERAQEALRLAHEIVQQKRHSQLDVEHILLALLKPRDGVRGGSAARLLAEMNIEKGRIGPPLRGIPGNRRIPGPGPDGRYQAPEPYSHDLTGLARPGQLGPGVGRAAEIRRVMQVLCRR